MRDVQLDDNGDFRCAACGGKNFSEKRTRRAKVIGVTAGVATLGVAGAAAPLIAKKRLYCQACGAYNQMGNAQPFKPTPTSRTQPPATSRKQTSPKQSTPAETLVMMLGLTVAAAVGMAFAISAGSVVWTVVCGIPMLLCGFGTFVTGINMWAARERRHRPPLRHSSKKVADLDSLQQGKYLEVKKRPPRR